MTEKEFAKQCKVNIQTVQSWIEKGYIPVRGQDEQGHYVIPDSARKPDYKARARKPEAIIKRILYAASEGLGIFPDLFKITAEEFNTYIDGLIKQELIVKVTLDGVDYFNITSKGIDYRNAKVHIKDDVVTIVSILFNAAQIAMPLIFAPK